MGDGPKRLPLGTFQGLADTHFPVVKLLLDRDDVEADSKDIIFGLTPLSRAAASGHEAVVRLLLERAGVETDSKDEDGRTPLL
jgi:ankyrin repeat protein